MVESSLHQLSFLTAHLSDSQKGVLRLKRPTVKRTFASHWPCHSPFFLDSQPTHALICVVGDSL